jgi:dTDP-glucose 4,6-dehydratase
MNGLDPGFPVVVTGGAGFLGTEVVRQLRASGHRDIRVVDLVPYAGTESGVTSFAPDVRTGDMARAFAGARVCLHLAACQYHTPLAKSTYELPFFEVNVDGTRRVLDAAVSAGVERFVFVSTNMVYGLPQQLPLREDHARLPFGPYGQSKLAAERIVENAHGSEIDAAIVRPGLIVGPGRTGVVGRVFDWVLGNRPIWLIGSGNNRYELIASEDVASLVLRAGAARGFGAYNCGAKAVPTMREWIGAVIEFARSSSRIVGIPGRPLKMAMRALETVRLAPLRKDQYLIADIDYYLDTTLARERLGWRPQWTGTDAMLATFRWYTGERGAAAGSGGAAREQDSAA